MREGSYKWEKSQVVPGEEEEEQFTIMEKIVHRPEEEKVFKINLLQLPKAERNPESRNNSKHYIEE
jgi:hypothetical protein